MKYDAIILSHPKDYNKISFCYESLSMLDPYPENIYLVTPDKFQIADAIPISDCESIDVGVDEIVFSRPNWIYQQLIKLYQKFSKNDIYMCVDSDVVFNRPIKFSGKTFFISDRDQHHEPYFNFMKLYFAIEEPMDQTFINDFMIFDKNICSIMMPKAKQFVKDLNQYLSNDEYLFSEFETYGNFVNTHFAGRYSFRPTKVKTVGKHDVWSNQELQILKNLCSEMDIDLFTAHTWT
tara:strand:- start:325 stop:1032 length:708 start_codon:yes stop_codon:yes gene_type:complete